MFRDGFRHYFKFEEDLQAFGLWAFGEGYEVINSAITFLKRWNELHDDELLLFADGEMSIDIPEMVRLWKESKM